MRSLAYVTGGRTTLVSRNGNPFRSFPELASLLSLEVSADDAVIDGEIVKLDEGGLPQFYDLMRRRGPFSFVAFDVLELNGKDVRRLALTDRKRLLRAIVPKRSSAVLWAQHIFERGRKLLHRAMRADLEGAKHRDSIYGADDEEIPFLIFQQEPDLTRLRRRGVAALTLAGFAAVFAFRRRSYESKRPTSSDSLKRRSRRAEQPLVAVVGSMSSRLRAHVHRNGDAVPAVASHCAATSRAVGVR